MPNKDSLREEITDICFNNGGVSKPMVDKLYKLFTSHIEEAERRARINEVSKVIEFKGDQQYLTDRASLNAYLRQRINKLKSQKGGE